MPAPKVTDAEFIELWKTLGSASKISKLVDVDMSGVHQRRRSIEKRYKIQLVAEDKSRGSRFTHLQTAHNHAARHQLGIENGVVIVFSDAHFWPGIRTTAFKGLLWAIREFKPKAIINNGDAFDGASISRFPRIGWDTKPSIIQELKACEASLGEIEEDAGRAKLIWTMGNHDSRFENRLAANAHEFEGVKGFSLRDHFPAWLSCWACWPTEDVCVKHRYKGGIHATHNNTVGAGKSMVTGHLHSLKVTPYSDYNPGVRFGVDTGTLADPLGPQFVDYLEDNPTNWRSGFAILTFFNGQLLWPELVHDFGNGCVEFRGEVIDVSGL